MPRETTADKAARLLAQGRVTVRRVADDAIVCRIRGDSARVYSTGWDPSGWFCNCEAGALRRRCSHVRAVQLIALEPLCTDGPGPRGIR